MAASNSNPPITETDPAAVPASEPSAEREVIRPLPRRQKLNYGPGRVSTLVLPPQRVFNPSAAQAFRRLLTWLSRIALFLGQNFWLRLTRRFNIEDQAKRLRLMLEQMGPTAIKVGQQLSVRADLLPSQYCDELSRMLDQVPPFEFELAVAVVEQTIGKPLGEVFDGFDPKPIGSASLACVYQARLHTGELVAVKVKRPGIDMKMATDLKAIFWIFEATEKLGIIRSGVTGNFRLELNRMLTEELDFCLEARYTAIFRRNAKKNRYVTAPKVFFDFSDHNVLVTEFVSGAFLSEILNALENEDPTHLEDFQARGFKPALIGSRMNQIFLWECFESHFFHADPHPANIIVKPDNTLVMIDFGSCGSVSTRMKRNLLSFDRFMAMDDLHGMVQDTIAMLEPLPHFDVDSFSTSLMNIFREVFIAHKSTHAPWYDKCSGGMWMKVIALSRKYHLPMTLDTVRMFRASFIYDSIIYRLAPDLDSQVDFRKWSERYNRKNKQRALNEARARLLGQNDADFTWQAEMNSTMERALHRFRRFLDQPSYDFALTIDKAAYSFTLLLKAGVTIVASTLVISVLRLPFVQHSDTWKPAGAEFLNAILWTVNNRIFVCLVALYLVITLRKLLFKMQDVDVK